MHDFYYKDLVSRFDSHGNLKCACGQTHHLDTRETIVSLGALEQSAELLGRRVGLRARVWVLSDENTEEAAGRRWKALAGPSRLTSRVLPRSPKPVPTAELVESLAAEAKAAAPDLLVSVGGGVISDLVKKLSRELDIPNWCVATAPSVDAYSSGTAAINVEAFHGSVPARASDVIVCDLDVMEKAPRDMQLAGLGDLLAKFLAYLDWNLSRLVTGEDYCALVSDTALQSARTALSAARRLESEPAEAARTLTDAALASGFAMQAYDSSRSAATAEHTMAHFWESIHSVGNPRWDLHGILTGAASRVMLGAYRDLYARVSRFEPDEPARLRAFDKEPRWQDTLEDELRPFFAHITREMGARALGRSDLEQRLRSFREHRAEVMRFADTMLGELSASIDTLQGIGFPFSLDDLGVPVEKARLAFRNTRLLRRRYSSLDLAYDLGLEPEMMEFGTRAIEAARE